MTILDGFLVCLFLAGGIIIAVLHFRAKKLMARLNELKIEVLLDKPHVPGFFSGFLENISGDFDFLVTHVGKESIERLPPVYMSVVYMRFEAELQSCNYSGLISICSKLSEPGSERLRLFLVSYNNLFLKNKEHIIASIEAHYSQYIVGHDNAIKSKTSFFKKELQRQFSFGDFYNHVLEPVFRERFSGIS